MTTQRTGGYRKTEFGELVKSSPERAAFLLQTAWSKEARASEAAKRLGISRRTFFRHVLRLESLGFTIEAPTSPTERRGKGPVSIPVDRGLQKSSESGRFVS